MFLELNALLDPAVQTRQKVCTSNNCSKNNEKVPPVQKPLMFPWRTFSIHGIFPFQILEKFFFILHWKKKSEKNCSLKSSLGKQKWFFYGIEKIILETLCLRLYGHKKYMDSQ